MTASREVVIEVEANQPGPDEAQRLVTRELHRRLRERIDGTVEISKGNPRPGEKGGFEANEIILELISSGSAAAIVESVRLAFKRDSNFRAKVTRRGGETVEIDATNLHSDQTAEAVGRLLDENR